MLQKTWVNESRKIIICVDSYEDDVLKGRFCDISQQVQQFSSWSQFLLKMEQMLDEMQLPQSYTTLRRYRIPLQGLPEGWNAKAVRGGQATFELTVIFRQHTSWQGILFWREGKMEHSFRSVLELVALMDSALQGRKGSVAV